MNVESYRRLRDHGIVGKVELLRLREGEEPVITCGNYELAFTAEQIRRPRRSASL